MTNAGEPAITSSTVMVEGNITKKLNYKHSFDIIFPAISRKKTKLSHSDILGNKNTFVDVNDLPIGSVIVRTQAGFDPFVTLAPPIKSCGTEFEKISVWKNVVCSSDES